MTREPRTKQFHLRRLLAGGLAILLVVGIVEVVLRRTGLAAMVDPPDIYYQPGVELRLEALDEVRERHGEIDLLFLGSSVVRTNFAPLVFDERLTELTGAEIVSFNGGLSDLFPDPVRLYLERFWYRHSHPRVVVQAVRYNEVRANVRASDFDRFRDGRLESLWISDDLLADVQAEAVDHSALLRLGGLLTQTLTDLATGPVPSFVFAIDERGWNRTGRTLTEARAQLAIEDIPGSDGAAEGYAHPIRPDDYEFGLEVLEETARLVEANGGVYVLVNMPEHADKFLKQPDGQERYAFYVERLRAFAADQRILFYDPTDGSAAASASDEPFSDFHHYNPEGAMAFSEEFAGFVAEHFDELFPSGG